MEGRKHCPWNKKLIDIKCDKSDVQPQNIYRRLFGITTFSGKKCNKVEKNVFKRLFQPNSSLKCIVEIVEKIKHEMNAYVGN